MRVAEERDREVFSVEESLTLASASGPQFIGMIAVVSGSSGRDIGKAIDMDVLEDERL